MKAKKFWSFLIFSLLGFSAVNAQHNNFSIGLKAGVGIPSLTSGKKSTPLSEGYSSRLGFYGGLVSELSMSENFGFRAELNYSSQGGLRKGMQAMPIPAEFAALWQTYLPDYKYIYADIKSEAILNYIEIPVMAKFRVHPGRKFDFYVQAGPYVGVLLNAKDITKGNSSIYLDKAGNIPLDGVLALAGLPTVGEQSFDNTQDITSDIHRINAGLQGAVGFSMKTGNGEIFIEGGGNYGLLQIQKDEANGTNNTGAGTVVLGYLFSF
jgi:hypothetical protein